MSGASLMAQPFNAKKDSALIHASTDTTAKHDIPQTSTALADSLALLHSPKRATLLSTFVPGLGQAYNQKYWKIPIIYAGFAGLAYGIMRYNKFYQELKFLYPIKAANPDAILHNIDAKYAAASFKANRDNYRRNRDLCIIGAGLFYVLNIVDATVDGYFYEYDISNDLGMKISPTLLPAYNYATLGLTFTFNLN